MNPLFNYYQADIKQVKPIGMVSLYQFFNAIRNPKPNILQIFKDIRKAAIDGNEEVKSKLKTQLYSFTPAVLVKDRRAYKSIQAFTGLAPLDFDKLPNREYAEELKQYLFNDRKEIIAAWFSSSGQGVRALIKIPICKDVDEYKDRYAAIEKDFGVLKGFDPAPKNCVLPLFLSHDPQILTRSDAVTYRDIYRPIACNPIPQYKITGYDKSNMLSRWAQKKFEGISNCGHPTVRATSYALGGHIAGGYISYQDAETLLFQLIDQHPYLKAKAATYKKTVTTMLTQGQSQPLYIHDE